MKALMYHYVRDEDRAQPFQRYLHVDDFEAQLDLLGDRFGFVERDEFDRVVADCAVTPDDCGFGADVDTPGRFPHGVVLTFDDALIDHAEVVAPILARRGLWGIFYVPTGPYRDGRMLAVHRIHHLVGTFGARHLLEALHEVLDDDMLAYGHVEEFRRSTYLRLDDGAALDEFKRTLNYLIDERYRDSVIDAVTCALGVEERDLATDYYCSPSQLRTMAAAGMVIGSHGDRHIVMSTMSPPDQRRDIEQSLSTLGDLVGSPIDSFCYPFGGFHTFDRDTEDLLGELGMSFAFNVESRDISPLDLSSRPMALPRYDCNLFPRGRASAGRTRAVYP